MKNKKSIKKYFLIISTCLIFLFIAMTKSHAYTSSNAGKNDYDTSGGFYFEINGGPSGNSRIHFQFKRLSGATSYNNMMSATSRWSVSMVASNTTNRHNIQIVDTSINTRLDVTDSYNVLSFRISYDMPAHYQYSSMIDDSPSGMRFNMNEYSYDGSGSNTAANTGRHSSLTTRRTINIQVNTGNTGLRTYGKYWYYNCTLGINIAKTARTVTQYHYYQTKSGWVRFNTTSNGTTDGNWFAPYNVGSPSGYSPGNNYGYYSSGGASLGGGTVGSNGITVCDNNTVNVHYYPNTYYVYYNANGGSGGPGTQAFTYNWGQSISSSTPSRTGYTFAGWDYAGNHFNPGQAIPSGWGSFTLTAKWNINSYYLDVNGWLDGLSKDGLYNYGTFDVYINGTQVANDVTDYYTAHPYGSKYEIKDVKATSGHRYTGVYSGSLTGTIGGNISTFLSFITTTPPVITTPVINNPDQNEILPFVSNGKLIIQLGDTFNAIKYATVFDKEDGNITSKLTVKSNSVPSSNGKTSTSGSYKVIYQVTDSDGLSTSKELIVIVNDPPILLNNVDRYYFVDQDVNAGELLKKLTAEDLEDGILTSKIKIKEIKYSSDEIVSSPTKLDTSKEGEYSIVFLITDSYKKTIKKEGKIFVKKDIQTEIKKNKTYSRLISSKYISSISPTSVWREADYYNILVTSLNKKTENQAIKVISISNDKRSNMKNFSNTHAPSRESNLLFISEFGIRTGR